MSTFGLTHACSLGGGGGGVRINVRVLVLESLSKKTKAYLTIFSVCTLSCAY